MSVDLEELFELEDVDTEFYMAGYSAAVVSYLLAGVPFVGNYNILRFSIFIALFFPVLYGFKYLWEMEE